MEPTAAEERRPLLQDTFPAETEPTAVQSEPENQTARSLRVIIPAVVILFLSEWAGTFIGVSMGALMERSICLRQYPDVVDSQRDPRCKGDIVQAELSIVRGWESSFILIPAIITAVPYNMLAERRGPKLVVLLMLVGQMVTHITELIVCLFPQTFNARWVWLCATFVFLGGRPVVFSAMQHYIASNITSEKNRATAFFYCLAVRMVGAMISGPAAYLCMHVGPVFTKCLVLVIGVIMITMQSIMPGDAIKRKGTSSSTAAAGTASDASVLRQAYSACKQGLVDLSAFIFADFRMALLLFTTFAFTIGSGSEKFRLQYATKRFGWTWDQASFIPSIASGIKFAMVVAVLPTASYILLNRYNVTGTKKDLWISRTLASVLLTGSFAIAIAPTGALFIAAVCLYEVSTGCFPASISFMASIAGEKHKGVVFGYIAVFEGTGGMLAGPILANLFNVGLAWGTEWYGLPFIFMGLLSLLILVIFFVLRESERQGA